MAFFLPFSSHALTSQITANQIQGSAPYLTFDGGRTRAVDTNGLLGITLSDGAKYTPLTNNSSTTPIVLPLAGQSFADISMFVPTDTNSVDLSSLIGPPNNYWGDDDGDSDVTVTGSLSLSIVDKYSESVSRSTVPEICKAPYRVTLSSTNGTLSTRYGFPNRSDFSASSVTYYVNPKAATVVCFARPNLMYGKLGDNPHYPSHDYAGPSSMWDPDYGFLPQSTESYGKNFPTTGANNMSFDLDIGSGGSLSWSPVSHGGITAIMTNLPFNAGVRVTLTGPYATESQQWSDSPSPISKPTLPQTFELVGRDRQGNPVVKYGFTLKQWFVNRGHNKAFYLEALSWCNGIGYRLVKVKDLTNASCRNTDFTCQGDVGATPSSPGNHFMRHIDSGFFTEWGTMPYAVGGVEEKVYWTSDPANSGLQSRQFLVGNSSGFLSWGHYHDYLNYYKNVLCTYP